MGVPAFAICRDLDRSASACISRGQLLRRSRPSTATTPPAASCAMWPSVQRLDERWSDADQRPLGGSGKPAASVSAAQPVADHPSRLPGVWDKRSSSSGHLPALRLVLGGTAPGALASRRHTGRNTDRYVATSRARHEVYRCIHVGARVKAKGRRMFVQCRIAILLRDAACISGRLSPGHAAFLPESPMQRPWAPSTSSERCPVPFPARRGVRGVGIDGTKSARSKLVTGPPTEPLTGRQIHYSGSLCHPGAGVGATQVAARSCGGRQPPEVTVRSTWQLSPGTPAARTPPQSQVVRESPPRNFLAPASLPLHASAVDETHGAGKASEAAACQDPELAPSLPGTPPPVAREVHHRSSLH